MKRCVDNNILIPEMAELLREGKEVRFTPTGVSMRPFIEGGKDVVVLRKQSAVKVGDIALAAIQPLTSNLQPLTSNAQPLTSNLQLLTSNTYVLHRVIAVDGETVTLLGDGNLGRTEVCTKADILGTVIRIENARGRRKPLTRGRLWYHLRPARRILLKIYRKLLKLGLLG